MAFLSDSEKNNKFFVFLTLILLGLHIYTVFSSGISVKNEKYYTGLVFDKMECVYTFLQVFFTVFVITYIRRHRQYPYLYALLFFLTYFICFMIVGERMLYVKAALTVVLLYHIFYKPVKLSNLTILFTAIIIASSPLQYYKNYLLRGEASPTTSGYSSHVPIEDTSSLLYNFFKTEFSTASDNLALITENIPAKHPFLMGTGTLNELTNLISFNALHEDRYYNFAYPIWFTFTFYPQYFFKGEGFGFSLVGQGWIEAGWIGVILIAILLALFIRLNYAMAERSAAWSVIYIALIPLTLHTIRGSLVNIYSPYVKHVLLPMLLLWMADFVVATVTRRNRRMGPLAMAANIAQIIDPDTGLKPRLGSAGIADSALTRPVDPGQAATS